MKIKTKHIKPKLTAIEWVRVFLWSITKNQYKKLKCPICGKPLFVVNNVAFRDFEPIQVICSDDDCKFNTLKLSPI
jgi:hypothetical protein